MIRVLTISNQSNFFTKLSLQEDFTYNHNFFMLEDVINLARKSGYIIVYNPVNSPEYNTLGCFSCKVVEILEQCPYCLDYHINSQHWEVLDKTVTPKQFCMTSKILAQYDFIELAEEAMNDKMLESHIDSNAYEFDIQMILKEQSFGLSEIYNLYSYRIVNNFIEILFYHEQPMFILREFKQLSYVPVNKNRIYVKINKNITEDEFKSLLQYIKQNQINFPNYYKKLV